ncbi:MAG: hypothetical protein K2L51_00025 [Clostridiales bacterium]|nr:hypothetical protein [Clostridiales bacterium]
MQKRTVVAVILLVLGVIAPFFGVFANIVCEIIGIAGILYAMALWTLYRTMFRTRQTLALAIAAVVSGAAGLLLLFNRFWGFVDSRYLVLAVLTAFGSVTVGLGLQLRERQSALWKNVTAAGAGIVAAGLLSLWRITVSFTAGCVTAAVLLLKPAVTAAVRRQKEKREKNKNVITVREKDIEVIPAEDDEKKE